MTSFEYLHVLFLPKPAGGKLVPCPEPAIPSRLRLYVTADLHPAWTRMAVTEVSRICWTRMAVAHCKQNLLDMTMAQVSRIRWTLRPSVRYTTPVLKFKRYDKGNDVCGANSPLLASVFSAVTTLSQSA